MADASISQARQLGEAQAELADLRLRLQESLAREQALLQRTLEAEEHLEDALGTEHDLRSQIERYARFHRDISHSRAWRMIQRVRRVFGREW
jgi:hypothetical protein